MIHRIIHRDICQPYEDVIFHQCNCLGGVWGAGVAKALKAAYPEAYAADVAAHVGGKAFLGNFSFAYSNGKTVYNIYGQQNVGYGKQTDEDALLEGLKAALSHNEDRVFGGSSYAMPWRIGAGLGGGDFLKITEGILNIFEGKSLTFYRWP